MPGLLVNIDVPKVADAERFYTAAFGLRIGRRFDAEFVELLGADVPIYLLGKAEGTETSEATSQRRRYQRHWTPVHVDLTVEDIELALRRALAAGAVQEGITQETPYGRLALLADPYGHGFCLIEFNALGYDALLEKG